MRFTIKAMHVSTGGPAIVLLHHDDAKKLDLYTSDRVKIKVGKKSAIGVVDILDQSGSIKPGQIGLFTELLEVLGNVEGKTAQLEVQPSPETLHIIKQKLQNKRLSKKEISSLVHDIVLNKFSDIELSYLIAAIYMRGLNIEETADLTDAIVKYGRVIKYKSPVLDKHCIGGIPGNRTTMIVVPLVVAAGYTMIKTSSRAITSASGTSDTIEVLASVTFTKEEVLALVKKTNGCMVWGGAVDLASADDRFVKLERPLKLDPEPILIASILAKKKAVSADYVLIDIPIGKSAKVTSCSRARKLKAKLIKVGSMIGLKIKVVITDGSQPIGNGVGPVLEARDVLWVLEDDVRAPKDLKERSLFLSRQMLKMVGIKKAKKTVEQLLLSKQALLKFQEIIHAQGGVEHVHSSYLTLGKYTYDFKTNKKGKITAIDNKRITKTASLAGAPQSKRSGVYLHFKKKDKVKSRAVLLTVCIFR